MLRSNLALLLLLAVSFGQTVHGVQQQGLCPTPTQVTAGSKTLDETLEAVEGLTLDIGQKVKAGFARRCQEVADCACTINMCSDNTDNLVCSTHAGLGRSDICKSETCDASPVDFEASAVHSVSRTNDASQKEVICGTVGVDDEFKQAFEAQDGLLWLYFGSYNGIFRSYPGHLWKCDAPRYDNRIRPWYRGASSGPKDVVIVLDVSGSMDNENRMELVKKAIAGDSGRSGLLDSMTQNDFVSIVTFSDDARVLQVPGQRSTEGMQRASKDFVDKLKLEVNDVFPQTKTNFLSGLKLAFEVLKEGADQERSSNCNRVIVFLTDGEDSECTPSCINDAAVKWNTDLELRDSTTGACRCVAAYLDKIEEWQNDLATFGNGNRANIFTYSMGSGAY
jgi:uncharacterized protein YegL